ncbi:MarP family serine protease [Crossiella sp. NPDC003009]
MNWVDLLVLLLALVAALSGARQGVIIAAPAILGALGGALLGLVLAPIVVAQFTNVTVRVVVLVAVIVLLAVLGETLGVLIGRPLREKIHQSRIVWLDNTLGAITQGAVVFVVAWLLAVPLTSVAGLPGLSSAVKGSAVLGTVDEVMPQAGKDLSGELRRLLNVSGFPTMLDPFSTTPRTDVGPADAALGNSPVAKQVQASVLKVRAQASSCSRALEGTGFVVARGRVMTNAHVVAGADTVAVEVGRGQFDATVVHYDPQTDLAVLDVPDLTAAPLPFAPADAKSGQDGIVLGYPLDGPYTATAARVRDRIQLRGPDIYESRTVTRDVYTVRGTVRSGNSGGPLVDPQGRVLGVVFGAAVDDQETGFVLTADEVADEVKNAPSMTRRVSTGACAR